MFEKNYDEVFQTYTDLLILGNAKKQLYYKNAKIIGLKVSFYLFTFTIKY
jgi:hypothetical protein